MVERPFVPGPAPTPASGIDEASLRAQRIQMLATEHWSLLATRSLSWNESFTRATMFLTLLSGSVVALALVAQATSFGEGFVVFALLLLPVVLIVGLATYVRLLEVNNEDLVWVVGMNRLRRAYLELDPDLARHLVTGVTEDREGMLRTYGAYHEVNHPAFVHGFVTTPATIAFVNSMLAAVLAAVVVTKVSMPMASAAAVGIIAFVACFAVLFWYGYRTQGMSQVVMKGSAPLPNDPKRQWTEGKPD